LTRLLLLNRKKTLRWLTELVVPMLKIPRVLGRSVRSVSRSSIHPLLSSFLLSLLCYSALVEELVADLDF
jgi:hypothetical protein